MLPLNVKMQTNTSQVFLEATEASLMVIAHKLYEEIVLTHVWNPWNDQAMFIEQVTFFYCHNNFSTASNTVGGGGFIADNTF